MKTSSRTAPEKTRLDLMIDLETTSCKPNAGILSISMVPFVLSGNFPDKDKSGNPVKSMGSFNYNVDLLSCFMDNFDFDKDTQEWWSMQDENLKSSFSIDAQPIKRVIEIVYGVLKHLSKEYELYVWSKGTDFDFPILENCFERYLNEKAPYNYWNKRDVRTYISDYEDIKNMVFTGTAHNSLDDCEHQILQVKEAWKRKK